MASNGLLIETYKGRPYKSLVQSKTWQICFLRADKPLLIGQPITKIERHLTSDEGFVLLEGEAILYIGKKQKPYPLKKNHVYFVKKKIWHAIHASKDATVLVVENMGVTTKNSEYQYFSKK